MTLTMTSPSRHEDHGSSKSGRALGFLCFAGLGSLTSRELKACGATDIVVKRLPGYDLVLA